jgi:hypothetical protein
MSKKRMDEAELGSIRPRVKDALSFRLTVSFETGCAGSMPLPKIIHLATATGPLDNLSMGPALVARSREIALTELERHRKQATRQEERDHPGH